MLDAKGLEAGARQEATWDGRDFDALGSADRSRYLGRFADGVTAYIQAVGPEPAVALKPLVAQIDALLALENPVPAIPHLARSLLASARSALVATPPAEPVVEAPQPANSVRKAAERVVWFDWSSNDPDAVAAVDALRAALATKPTVKDDEAVVEALRTEAGSAYCRFLDKMSAPLCLGVEYKLETGKFGAAELNAHVDARELYGFHRGINHALAALAAKDGRS